MDHSKRSFGKLVKKFFAVACAATMIMSCAVTTSAVSAGTPERKSVSASSTDATQMRIYDENGNDISENPIIYVDNSYAALGITSRKLKVQVSNESGYVDDPISLAYPVGMAEQFVELGESTSDSLEFTINGAYTDDKDKEQAIKSGTYTISLYTQSGEVYRPITVVVYKPGTNMKIFFKTKNNVFLDAEHRKAGTYAVANHQYKFFADVLPGGSTDKVEWSVYDGVYYGTGTPVATKRAEITEDGLFTPKLSGTVTVVAKFKKTETSDRTEAYEYNSKEDKQVKTVPKFIKVTILRENPAMALEIENAPTAMEAGESVQLKLNATPSKSGAGYDTGATDEFTWISSNPKVATVDSKGLVTAVGKGDVKITVLAENQTVFTECNIRVMTKATSVRVTPSPTSTRVDVGTTLTATMSPATADDEIEWSSSDERIATVVSTADGKFTNSQTATVTGVAVGKAVITARAKNSGVESSVTVTVYKKVQSTSLDLTTMINNEAVNVSDNSTLKLFNAHALTINATLRSDDGSTPDDTIKWDILNNEMQYVTVDSSTSKSITLKGVSEGIVTVKASSASNPKLSRSFKVQVLRGADMAYIQDASTGSTITSKSINARDTLTVTADLKIQGNYPYNHSDSIYSWTSSAPSVATIDNSGIITAVSTGTAKIFMTTESGISRTLTVTVYETSQVTIKASGMVASEDGSAPTLLLSKKKTGETTVQFSSIIYDQNNKSVSNTTPKWSSSNNAVATIDEKGLVTAHDLGSAIITVSSGMRTDQCVLEVKEPMTNCTFVNLQAMMYDPAVEEYRPTITICNANLDELVEGVDYELTYSNNTTVGQTGKVVATGIGHYTGTVTGSFRISPRVINDPDVIIETIPAQECTGTAIIPELTVTHHGKTLEKGVDYTVTGTNNKLPTTDAVKATLKLTGKGNYSGTTNVSFEIYCSHPEDKKVFVKNLQKANCQQQGKDQYKCSICGELFEVTTPLGDHNYVKTKTVAPTYTAQGYTLYTCSVCQKEKKADYVPALSRVSLSTCTVTLSQTTFTENGSVQVPKVTVKDGTKTLVENTDYTLTYSNKSSKTAGTYSIKVVGINGYKDSVTKTYTIKAASVNPTSISLNITSATLGVGETLALTATINPSNATKTVTWTTSNSTIATVSGGKVTAKKAGTATITAKTVNGKTATCKITVKEPAASISISKTALTMGVGEQVKLTTSVTTGASYKRTFTSSDSTVVKIVTTTTGTVTFKGLKAGTANITVKTFNGKTATCKVTVKAAAASISISPTSLTLKVGQTYKLNTSVTTGASYNRTFTTSNSAVAAITATTTGTCTIKAMKAGTAYITVKTFNGKTAKCTVKVTA